MLLRYIRIQLPNFRMLYCPLLFPAVLN